MNTIKRNLFAFTATLLTSACSVQQFAVNTKVQPFEHGGHVFGERTTGKEFKRDNDLIVFGFNVKQSNAQRLAQDLDAKYYTIETKSNIWVYIITFGIVDYKIVKVIKRDN
jgi:hypothetical protein